MKSLYVSVMKFLSVVGARPQFVKLAPIVTALPPKIDHLIVHTGQHYDEKMSNSFFRDLEIPKPLRNLEAGSGSHAEQTARIMVGVEEVLTKTKPDMVIVYGDTNSTVAGSLVAAKLHIPVAHVEAGLRSWNRKMPEEVNRIVADHLAELCLAPTEVAMANLSNEGLQDRSELVGDIMVDALRFAQSKAESSPIHLPFQTGEPYILATFHRQELADSPKILTSVLSRLDSFPIPVHLVAHPRLQKVLDQIGFAQSEIGSLRVHGVLDYLEMVTALFHSHGVVTDSGGLQKEAYLLRKPCLTVRAESEWVETVHSGWNKLVWEDLNDLTLSHLTRHPAAHNPLLFGDGHAANRIVSAVMKFLS